MNEERMCELPLRLTVDVLLPFEDHRDCLAQCRLRVYERRRSGAGHRGAPPWGPEPPVVLATELPNNPGQPVAATADLIACRAWLLLERPPRGLRLIGHWGPGEGAPPRPWLFTFESSTADHFAEAAFAPGPPGAFAGPRWLPLDQTAVVRLFGGAFEA